MNQKGFTLIELLVTMGIIAVLTGFSIFNFNQSRVRARDVQRKSDLGQLMKALELYKNDTLTYPENPSTTEPDPSEFQNLLLNGEYIKEFFNDPKGSEWKNYMYINIDTDLKKYAIMACLENKVDTARAVPDQCRLFPNYAGMTDSVVCKCGAGTAPSSYTGTMYIVSNQ